MTVYLVTIFILFLFGLGELNSADKKYKTFYSYFLYFLLVFQVGLRWETGTDWIPYLNNFTNTGNIDDVFVNSSNGFELCYGFFVLLVHTFTNNYSIFLLIHALIYYFLIFQANKRISPFPFVSLLLFYVSTIGVLGSNRQLIALSICLFALQFVIDKNPIKFFLLIFLAIFFHTSALIFAIYYFLNRDFKKYQIIGVLIVAFVIGNTSLPNVLFSSVGNILGEVYASKASNYSEKGSLGDYSLSTLGLIRRFIYFLLFFITYDVLSKKLNTYKLFFNGFFLGLVFYLLFSNSLMILVNRGSLYFNVMEVFLLTSQILLFPINKDRFIILFLMFSYSFYLFFQSISVYADLIVPYKGVFINSEYVRDLY